MFVLCKLEKRAETTDTIVIVGAKERYILEELLLSIFDEIFETEMKIAEKEEEYSTEEDIRTWCIEIMNCYQIVKVPVIE
jgi:hypothetical protein